MKLPLTGVSGFEAMLTVSFLANGVASPEFFVIALVDVTVAEREPLALLSAVAFLSTCGVNNALLGACEVVIIFRGVIRRRISSDEVTPVGVLFLLDLADDGPAAPSSSLSAAIR